MNCTCDIVYLDGGILGDEIIEYCPMHKAAPELLKALRTLVNNLPVPEIELARSAWGNINTACVLEARAKAVEAIAKVEGDNNG